MTERKKIIDVLRDNIEYEVNTYPDDNYTEVVIKYGAIADALIAAGIGDTTNLIAENEVLQRALRSLAQLCAKAARFYLQSDKAVKERERELYDEWIKQSKKELAEEEDDRKRKNDRENK